MYSRVIPANQVDAKICGATQDASILNMPAVTLIDVANVALIIAPDFSKC
jgi:hypothetical protein